MAAILVLWPSPKYINIFPFLPKDCIWNWNEISKVILDEKSFEKKMLKDYTQVTFVQDH